MKIICVVLCLSLFLVTPVFANSQPVVSNVVAVQRPHTALVDVTFDLADADGDAMYVTLWYSLDDGATWDNQCVTVTGEVGDGVMSGTGHAATWDAGADVADFYNKQFRLRVYADDGSSSLWAEDFEQGCPGGWTLGGDWECGVPTYGPSSAFNGVACLGTVLGGTYNNNQSWNTAIATSPLIDLSTASAPQLKFRVWILTEGSVYDGFNLKISTDSGTSFQVLNTVNPPYSNTINGEPAWGGDQSLADWQEFTADLSAYAGQTVLLRLAFRSDNSIVYPGVYADAFEIND